MKQGLLTEASPRTRVFAGADWDLGPWRLHGQLTRYGKFTVLSSVPVADQTFGAKVLTDLSATYAFRGWSWTLGANNIFNVHPQKTNAANNFDGMLVYHFLSPFGFNGAYWYATMGYRW